MKKYMQKYGLYFIVGVILSCTIGVVFFHFSHRSDILYYRSDITKNTTSKMLPYAIQDEDVDQDQENEVVVENDVPMIEVRDIQHIEKGDVSWCDPEEIDDSDLSAFAKASNEFTGFKHHYRVILVGNVTAGSWKGAQVLVISVNYIKDYPSDGSASFYTVLKRDGTFFVLNAPSLEYIDADTDRDQYFTQAVGRSEDDFGSNEHFVYTEPVVIDELIAPKTIMDPKNNITLERVGRPGKFFDTESLVYAADIDGYGPIWRGKASRKDVVTLAEILNEKLRFDEKREEQYFTSDRFVTGALYGKLPDGMAVGYAARMPFLNDNDTRVVTPDIVWNNGEDNIAEFDTIVWSCGISRYADDVTDSVSLKKNMRVAGTASDGTEIYEFSRGGTSFISDLYANYAQYKKDAALPMTQFLDGHPVIFFRDPYGRTIALYNTEFREPAECGKPVIYLYPEKEMDVSVEVKPEGGITVSDPVYGEHGWHVHAYPDGTLRNNTDNKMYGSLFWEGGGEAFMPEQSGGFVVGRNNLRAFFDETLANIGLITREIEEFEAFWVPKMLEDTHPYFFIAFYGTDFMNQNAPLAISPKPDTVFRVLMDYEGRDKYEDVPSQQFSPFRRKGFTVVEWGGVLR